jgi:GTP-binding protein Era
LAGDRVRRPGEASEAGRGASAGLGDGIGGGLRSGFAAVVGRPNVGKSTLTNALVGEKIAITSSKPETTRHRVRGIIDGERHQVVLVDTPGLHRPRTLLGERLNAAVREALADVDVAVVCLPADQAIGPGDRFLLAALPPGLSKVAAVTKADAAPRAALAAKLVEVDRLADWRAVVPVSAIGGDGGPGVGELAAVLAGAMPAGPRWYPRGEATDEPLEVRIAELVREAVLEMVRDELPHSVAALVDEIDLPRIRVWLFVERDSQKGIVIGRRGAGLKAVGSRARPQIEALVGRKVFLEIQVKVAKEWQRDPKALNRLGF